MRFCKYLKLIIFLFVLGYVGILPELYVYGEEVIQIELIPDKTEIQPGEEVQIQVNLIKGEYLAGMSAWFGYDDTVLEVTSAEASKEVLFPATVNPNGKKDGKSFVGYSYASADGVTDNGTILTIKFKVLENVTQNQTEISVIHSDAAISKSDVDITTADVQVSPVSLKIGTSSDTDTSHNDKSNVNESGDKQNKDNKSSKSDVKPKDKNTENKNNSEDKNEMSDEIESNSNSNANSNSNERAENNPSDTTITDKENSETSAIESRTDEDSEKLEKSEVQTKNTDEKNTVKKKNNQKKNKTIMKIIAILVIVIVLAGSVVLYIYKKRDNK